MVFEATQEIADIVADVNQWRYCGCGADGRDQNVSRAERLGMLDRQDRAMARGPLDPAYDHVARFEAAYLKNALFAGQPKRALSLVLRR